MTPLEIRQENARREREEAKKQKGKLPPRRPAPASALAEIARIKDEQAKKGQR